MWKNRYDISNFNITSNNFLYISSTFESNFDNFSPIWNIYKRVYFINFVIPFNHLFKI